MRAGTAKGWQHRLTRERKTVHMGLHINDPLRDITPERWQDAFQREYVVRDAARRWLLAALVSCLSKAFAWCFASRTVKGTRCGLVDH